MVKRRVAAGTEGKRSVVFHKVLAKLSGPWRVLCQQLPDFLRRFTAGDYWSRMRNSRKRLNFDLAVAAAAWRLVLEMKRLAMFMRALHVHWSEVVGHATTIRRRDET